MIIIAIRTTNIQYYSITIYSFQLFYFIITQPYLNYNIFLLDLGEISIESKPLGEIQTDTVRNPEPIRSSQNPDLAIF